MKSKVLLAIGIGALLAAPALAGINPAAPGLPTVLTASEPAFSANVPNNQISAMCVDCHTVAPKPGGGSHYVNTLAGGETNSGGSGILAGGGVTTSGSDDGKYFKTDLWSVNTAGASWPSKYGRGYVSVVGTLPTGVTRMNASVTTIAAATDDIICESCHNIVGNENGGNNLLAVQPTNTWETADYSEICVGCHGYMYTIDAANATINGTKYSSAINASDFAATAKGNNEYHWIRGTSYNQNHHAMTGDVISGTLDGTGGSAGAGLLWTDNLVIAYADHNTTNTYGGTAGQRAPWTHSAKPTSGGLNCVNCHAPAHGIVGEATSPAASILRRAVYTGTAGAGADIAGTLIERIAQRGGWKKIDDRAYCGLCHL